MRNTLGSEFVSDGVVNTVPFNGDLIDNACVVTFLVKYVVYKK